MNNPDLHTTSFLVHVPNLEGDGIAETVPIEVQCFTDAETGEEVLTPESLERIEQIKARRMGLISSEELNALRERLDLTQEEISDLLQIGAKTYTRWESGRARPSRSMNVLLCALRDGVISLEYLRALRSGNGVTQSFARQISASIWPFGRREPIWETRSLQQEVPRKGRVETPMTKGDVAQFTVYYLSGVGLGLRRGDAWSAGTTTTQHHQSRTNIGLDSEEDDTLEIRS